MAVPLELLSPAGNAEIGIAAIDHGADAVYIGAPKFSARFDAGTAVSDIARLIQHAHLYYARVYVALNTILTDAELPEALDIIQEVFRLGADGLILQDVGLLELDLPPIPLIASTQMHNNTPEKVQFLQEVGFKRVILARELSLEEITAIRHQTLVDLEVFVHGALCVSYSGQCYMSQAVTGRSGNRGVCAQPCRSRYTLTDADGNVIRTKEFLLSLKDLNRLNSIPDLVTAGVTCFKIEGRYKGIDYVKNVTAAYRQVIDAFISGHPDYRRSSSGVSEVAFSPDPDRTFNRGYTDYFFSRRVDSNGLAPAAPKPDSLIAWHSRKGFSVLLASSVEIQRLLPQEGEAPTALPVEGATRAPAIEKVASTDTQKSIGQYVGTVASIGRDHFILNRHDLHNGDGLCFFNRQRELAGFRVDRVDKDKIFPNNMKGLSVGVTLYRNHDAAFTRILKKPSASRRIAVEMNFTQRQAFVRLAVRDEDGNQAEKVFETVFEPPRNPSQTREQIEKHLSSTGNTPYHTTKLTIEPQRPGFLPISFLNHMRRDVLETLTLIRFENYPSQTAPLVLNDAPYPEKRLDFRANVLNEQGRLFYRRHGVESIEPAFEILPDPTGRTVMTTRYCIRHQLDLCPKYSQPGSVPKEPLQLSDKNHTYRLQFDCRNCLMFVILEK